MAFGAVVELSSLDGTNGFQIGGVSRGGRTGSSVASAGDVNGDGFADVVVGAPYTFYNGASYVVFGRAGGFAAEITPYELNGRNGFVIEGEGSFRYNEGSVSSAGDVNGDGFDDVIVGASYADPNGFGASYVVFGRAGGFGADFDSSTLNGRNGFRINGEAENDQSGYSVSSAGDVNGDGFDDVIVGAPSANPQGDGSGASYVVFGRAGGFGANLNLSELNGTTGFQLSGEAALNHAGGSVSAGDVNGDGFDDLIVAASGADPNRSGSGAAYVVFGRATGFTAELNLSALSGRNGFQLSGEAEDYFGVGAKLSVATAGDINHDGFDDLIVGSAKLDSNGNEIGGSYVVFGRKGGFAPEIDLSTLNGRNGFQIVSEAAANSYSGYSVGYSVASAGDVNGDGFDDLIVGAIGAGPNGYSSGASYVVFGRAGGFAFRD